MRRYNIPGQVHFVTTKTYYNKEFFWDDRICRIFYDVLDNFRKKGRFDLCGHVLIPNHTHLLLRPKEVNLPPMGSSDCLNPSKPGLEATPATQGYTISEIMHSIKRSSSRLINQKYPHIGFKWQPDFYDFNIYSEKKFLEKLNYIHNNPVKHGLVNDPENWLYSSWHNYNCRHSQLIDIDFME